MASSSSSSAAAAPVQGKMIKLRSSDGEEFVIEEAVAIQSQTIRHMIEDDCADTMIPLANTSAKILAKVIEYCKKHIDDTAADQSEERKQEVKLWDAEFVKVEQPVLFDLLLAANYLDIKNLLDLACQTVADSIKDKSVEEVRKIFNVENDFTSEEEEQIRKENQWAFE